MANPSDTYQLFGEWNVYDDMMRVPESIRAMNRGRRAAIVEEDEDNKDEEDEKSSDDDESGDFYNPAILTDNMEANIINRLANANRNRHQLQNMFSGQRNNNNGRTVSRPGGNRADQPINLFAERGTG